MPESLVIYLWNRETISKIFHIFNDKFDKV